MGAEWFFHPKDALIEDNPSPLTSTESLWFDLQILLVKPPLGDKLRINLDQGHVFYFGTRELALPLDSRALQKLSTLNLLRMAYQCPSSLNNTAQTSFFETLAYPELCNPCTASRQPHE